MSNFYPKLSVKLVMVLVMTALSLWPLNGALGGSTRCMAYTFSNDKPMEAKDDPSVSGHKAGEQWGPVTQVDVDKKNGVAFYCAHGDYCYPASKEWVSNCVIYRDPDETFDPDTQYFSTR